MMIIIIIIIIIMMIIMEVVLMWNFLLPKFLSPIASKIFILNNNLINF